MNPDIALDRGIRRNLLAHLDFRKASTTANECLRSKAFKAAAECRDQKDCGRFSQVNLCQDVTPRCSRSNAISVLKLRFHGFTLMELLVALSLTSVVFLAAISVYLSALKFLKTTQQSGVSTNTVATLEDISKRISLANSAVVTGGGNPQLNVRADYAVCSYNVLNTPANVADDNWWHYRLINNALRFICDANAATAVSGTGSILIDNVNTGGSTLRLINPSAAGNPTVVNIHVVTTSPVLTLDTNVALGAASKN